MLTAQTNATTSTIEGDRDHVRAATVPVIFDGSCRFCRRQMGWIQQRDRSGAFEFVPSSAPDLLSRFPMLAGADLSTGLRVVLADGRVAQSADAVYEIARRLPRWRRLTWLYRIPLLNSLWKALYRWIAANRYRFMGKCDDGVCKL